MPAATRYWRSSAVKSPIPGDLVADASRSAGAALSSLGQVADGPDPRFLALHGLRLKGFAEADAVARLVDVDETRVKAALADLEAEGLVARRDGRVSGWTLTPAGRHHHKALVADEVERARCRQAVHETYQRFLDLNDELKQVCTDWQLRSGALNDHSDAQYDRGVIERLRGVHEAVEPVCGALVAALPRFAPYSPRFSHALGRVEAGERDWFAKPVIDSYHTVWFELHEDLLLTLEIERASEGSA